LVIDAPLVSPSRLITNDIADLSSGTGPSDKFRILGRKDNVICSGGIKIQIEQVERLLHPHLQEPFLITKRPDAKFGEVVVLLTEGTVDEARQVCARVLPKYNQPKAYLHVDKIPLTETGKPARKEAENIAKNR
jgi:O-succinylbenzoic acid--CoA ligase